MSAIQLARETGVRQQSLSRWLQEARSLPTMAKPPKLVHTWTVEQKVRVLAEASDLNGEDLTTYLERAGVKFAEYEQWRLALEEGGAASVSAEAQASGARLRPACQVLGLSARTIERWRLDPHGCPSPTWRPRTAGWLSLRRLVQRHAPPQRDSVRDARPAL
jgi:transcriptional regulator with XRE-family HTH domain